MLLFKEWESEADSVLSNSLLDFTKQGLTLSLWTVFPGAVAFLLYFAKVF